jgi:hypothetical protein
MSNVSECDPTFEIASRRQSICHSRHFVEHPPVIQIWTFEQKSKRGLFFRKKSQKMSQKNC